MTLALLGAACSGDDSDSDSAADDTGTQSTADDIGDCPSEPFTGEIVREVAVDGHEAVSLTGDDIVLAEAVVRSPNIAYTIYLADYDLGDQEVGSGTIEADAGQVVVSLFVENDESLEAGESYEVGFNPIIDSGGGASADFDEPTNTVTIIAVTDSQICLDADFSDASGQLIRGTISAEITG